MERTLLPGVKADRKIESLYRTPAPWPRPFEGVPALFLALPQRRSTKWLRNGSAAVVDPRPARLTTG